MEKEITHNKKTKYYIYTLKRELSELLKEGKIDEKTMKRIIERLNDIEITHVSEIAESFILLKTIQDCIKNIQFN